MFAPYLANPHNLISWLPHLRPCKSRPCFTYSPQVFLPLPHLSASSPPICHVSPHQQQNLGRPCNWCNLNILSYPGKNEYVEYLKLLNLKICNPPIIFLPRTTALTTLLTPSLVWYLLETWKISIEIVKWKNSKFPLSKLRLTVFWAQKG